MTDLDDRPAPTLETRIRRATGKIHNPEKDRATVATVEQLSQLVQMQHTAGLALIAKTTELTELLMSQALNGILETRTVKLNSTDGTFVHSFRAPFAALTVINATGSALTFTNATREATAPTTGPGVVPVLDGVTLTIPIVGNHLTIYGRPGAIVTFIAYAKPIDSANAGPSRAPDTGGDTTQALNVAVNTGTTVALAAPSAARNSLLVVNTDTTTTLWIGYDAGGTTNAVPIAPGASVRVGGGQQLYATNRAAGNAVVSYMAD